MTYRPFAVKLAKMSMNDGTKPPYNLEIAPISPREYAKAAEILLLAYKDVLGGTFDAGYGDFLADIAGRAASSKVLVAKDSGLVVGCVTYVAEAGSPLAQHAMSGEAEIRMLGVDPSYQGHGIGKALTRGCIQLAKDDQKRAVFLHSTSQMIAAHSIYRSLGFNRVLDRDVHLEEVTLLAFSLDLDRSALRPREL
ncbi:MAG: GNAT family N-acetyltransferase [Ferrimicrobium sp.]